MLRKYILLIPIFLTFAVQAQLYTTVVGDYTVFTGISAGDYNLHYNTGIMFSMTDSTFILSSPDKYVFTSSSEISFEPGFSSTDGSSIEAYIRSFEMISNTYTMYPKNQSKNVYNSGRYLSFIYKERYMTSSQLSFTLYDMSANNITNQVQIVGNESVVIGNNKYTIDTQNLPKGYYVLEVMDAKYEKWYVRFIK